MITAQAVIAANRFGLGARAGELAAAAGDPRGWLLAQIRTPESVPEEIRSLPPSADILREFFEAREEKREIQRETAALEYPKPSSPASAPAEKIKVLGDSVRRKILPFYLEQVSARVRLAAITAASFHERLVQFWSNHFAVSVDKPVCLGIAGAFENEAIRPRVTGRFVDLLLAVEHHPAMIAYLDNEYSVGADSRLASMARRKQRDAKRKLDINENLAREILELHTLGVGSGYTQADVTSFARVLTGWSIGGGKGMLASGTPGAFEFRDNLHEPGSQTLLRKTYAEGGEQQGIAVLQDLAHHPATARHLATKLVRHFIADDPPAHCVERLARTYLQSDGDLGETYGALVHCDEAWRPEPAKFKSAQDFIYSAYRSMNFLPKDPRALLAPFDQLGQRPFAPGSPAGWADGSNDWDGSDALMKRIEWASALADRIGSNREPLDIAHESLGPIASQHTLDTVARAASAEQGIALLLMSPEFQRR